MSISRAGVFHTSKSKWGQAFCDKLPNIETKSIQIKCSGEYTFSFDRPLIDKLLRQRLDDIKNHFETQPFLLQPSENKHFGYGSKGVAGRFVYSLNQLNDQMIWILRVKYFKMKEHPNKKQINNVLDIAQDQHHHVYSIMVIAKVREQCTVHRLQDWFCSF